MALPKPKKLTKLELRIMETLWSKGSATIREMQEAFPASQRPAYTTIQTVVYRLEFKKALRRVKRVANAHVFEAVISREAAHHRFIDDLLGIFGGRALPIMTHLIDSGKLTPEDAREARLALRKLADKEKLTDKEKPR